MKAQQPPFLICVPIAHSADWPGLAAQEIEALLDGLGNPAGPALGAALDETEVVHFLSMAVVWDEDSGDPPMLVADVAADGPPKDVIAALVEHAWALLLPVFQAAAGVASKPELQQLLERCWVEPLPESWPLWPHRATGLAFQGTPGFTVKQIKDDARIAQHAGDAVHRHAARGPSPALSYIGAARTAASVAPRAQVSAQSLSAMAPTLAPRGSGIPFATSLNTASLVVFDWSYLFILLFLMVCLNVRVLGSGTKPDNSMLLAIPLAVVFGIVLNFTINVVRAEYPGRPSAIVRGWLTVATLASFILATWWAIHLSSIFSHVIAGAVPVLGSVHPFALWVTCVLGLLSLVLFLLLVAGALLAVLRWRETKDKPVDDDPDPARLTEIMRREDLPPHRQNHIIAVSTIKPGFFRRLISLPAGLYASSLTVRSGLFKTGFLAGIGTIHFIQWACIPRTNKLVFTGDYDGSWQSYLEDAVTLLPQGASAIWSNAQGFPKTSWLFFDGATDGDRFKRWVRRQMIPTRFWYSAYPDLTTTDIRVNAAIRCGLEAESITPSQAEIWLSLFGSAPKPVSDIETDQIQGLALVGYRNLLEGALLPVSFSLDPKACRAWLAGVSAQIDFGDAGQTQSAMAVALSTRGLERLGVGAADPLAARFSPPFAMGMASQVRSRALGDVDGNAPEEWAWGGPKNPVDAVLLIYALDQPTLQARLEEEKVRCGQAGLSRLPEINFHRWPPPRDSNGKPMPITEPFGFVDGISQPSIRGLASSHGAIATDLLEPGEFILGYPDGRQQFPPTPQVFAFEDSHGLLPDLPTGFPPQPSKKPVRDLGRNGSYLVVRQLKQNVTRYKEYVEAEAIKLGQPPDWVAAKMVGRWRNGAPLALFPHAQPAKYDPISKDEKFLFGRDDPQGLACPIGAHIRRANPRDQFDPDNKTQMTITNRHRILRRGRSYVAGEDSGEDPQGLLFMCLNADIERQFEFLQQTWIGSTSFGPLRDESDPLTAPNRMDGTYTIPAFDRPMQLTGLPSFVSMIGGGYFFLPGRQALNFLSS